MVKVIILVVLTATAYAQHSFDVGIANSQIKKMEQLLQQTRNVATQQAQLSSLVTTQDGVWIRFRGAGQGPACWGNLTVTDCKTPKHKHSDKCDNCKKSPCLAPKRGKKPGKDHVWEIMIGIEGSGFFKRKHVDDKVEKEEKK